MEKNEVAFEYHERNANGRVIPGVPARALTLAEYERQPAWTRAGILRAPFYVRTKAFKAYANDLDLERIDGIGQTYAIRLRAAGIDNVVTLAGADPASVARAAQVSDEEAAAFISAAGDRVAVSEATTVTQPAGEAEEE